MLEVQHASEVCSHWKPCKCIKPDPFLPRTLAENVAVQIFTCTFTGLSIELASYLDSTNEHAWWQGPLRRSQGPWFCSSLARNLTPFKLCVPYDPLRVPIPMSSFPLKVALLDEDVSAGTRCPPAITYCIARTSRTNQI